MRYLYTPIITGFINHTVEYPTSTSTDYSSNFGSLAGICLIVQIISGVLLVMHYTPHIQYAFSSVEHIMRDVNEGWVIRYVHSNGASIFFLLVYIHYFRNETGDGFPNAFRQFIDPIIFILIMAISFIGYLLPWGQMSFWGATVITNLFAAIPLVGQDVAEWLWGGYSIDNPTLNRFFSLHYLLPFLLVAVVLFHLISLHISGSESDEDIDDIDFYPYFYLKDLITFFYLILSFITLVCFSPNLLGHPDNYIMANNLVTPTHLVPEWYFLPFYAILRSTPDKFGGLLSMVLGLIIFFDNDNTDDDEAIILFILLGWLGGKPVEEPYVEITQIVSVIPVFEYFFDDCDEDTAFEDVLEPVIFSAVNKSSTISHTKCGIEKYIV